MTPPSALPVVDVETDQPPSVVAKHWSRDVAQCNATFQDYWELQEWVYKQESKK